MLCYLRRQEDTARNHKTNRRYQQVHFQRGWEKSSPSILNCRQRGDRLVGSI